MTTARRRTRRFAPPQIYHIVGKPEKPSFVGHGLGVTCGEHELFGGYCFVKAEFLDGAQLSLRNRLIKSVQAFQRARRGAIYPQISQRGLGPGNPLFNDEEDFTAEDAEGRRGYGM